MIKVFRLRAQSKLMTGIEGPFDTSEVDEYLSKHNRAAVVSTCALNDTTIFVVVNEPERK